MSQRILLCSAFLFICFFTKAQTVTVDSPRPAEDLVNILFDDSCAEISNVSISSTQAAGYFNNNGGAFPLANGVILRTGVASLSAGSYTGNDADLSSRLNSNGDPYLQDLNATSGNTGAISETSFLEFDFVPLASNFSFNFIFASNEYGEWQCSSQDIMAIVLTDLGSGQSQNLAVTPAGEPVAVRNIRDQRNNPACNGINSNLFNSYEVNNPQSTINMRGYTQMLNASSSLTPGNTYRIRIAIADANDADFDSAIFLQGGSFNTSVNLGPDFTLCSGDSATLTTDLDASVYQHRWLYNGTVITGQTGNSININQSGTYTVRVTNNGCLITDEVVVNELSVREPEDLQACFNGGQPASFDLTLNNASTLGLQNNQFEVVYYASQANLNAGQAIPQSEITNYQSSGNQTIFIRLRNGNTGNFCDAVYDFRLSVLPEIQISQPQPLERCASGTTDTSFNLTQINNRILNGQNPANFNITYYESEADAQNATAEVASPYILPSGTSSRTLWARVAYATEAGCFEVVSFEILINNPPPVDSLSDVFTCTSYELPTLTNGSYFLGANGTGQRLNAGEIITEDTEIFIYNGPDANGCSSQSVFSVNIVSDYDLAEREACGVFEIPSTLAGDFYTQPGGPNGSGNRLAPGTELTSSQTIYFYFEENGTVCRDDAFAITVFPLPPVDQPEGIIACTSYTLPSLTNGNYYTQPDGGGTQLNAGQVISNTQTVYIFNDDNRCTNEYAWRIFIVPQFTDVTRCGSYTLPNVEQGSFYTQPNGGGTVLSPGSDITTSQEVYYFVETNSGTNCTSDSSFEVTVIAIPPVDSLDDQLLCEGDVYELPVLANGDYFDQPNRQGNQYAPGTEISESIILYINNEVNGCSDETSFEIEVRPALPIDNLTFVYSCEPYVLPDLIDGSYFTESQGQGTRIEPGTVIDATTTIYIYNGYDDFPECYSENAFEINILSVTVPVFEDVAACDSYTLPPLDEGGYFTETGGQGTQLAPGDVITQTQELFIYARNGTRFFCEDESSFTITVSSTPVLTPEPDVEQCGSYILPDLPQDQFVQAYYLGPNKQNPINPADNTLAPGSYTIYKYAEAADNPNCFDEDVFEVTVYPLLDFTVEGGTVCRDAVTGDVISTTLLESGLSPAEFLVSWSLNGTVVGQGPDFVASEAGVYTVSTEKLNPEVGANCNYNPTTVEVFESAVPVLDAEVSQPFAETSVIEVSVTQGYGTYEYQLDDGFFQENPRFENVQPGVHTVTVRGVNGTCGAAVIEVVVIDFPKYFTPNNDGFNDTWNISSLQDYPETQIFIFNRFGKLIKSLQPNAPGWDGTYNGRNLPSDDYWFYVEFIYEERPVVFKSHFTLKR
ncbi:T9SS type B sorting domain-containing protein [Leeuwenhoekiella parthenopeia]|uniref:T9SS type B sorting domain-containing protein n=1 Tax=Leeuwenhoekiella parthenopeia TaxID=2890320 RepID=A0ABS8GPV0_9FLAO|nr:T9SS type B sorting domain-containing protein [Leeuwenhoekiella parthenopeia]MCC4211312.1 T9SS type B sorting domain-containing protein [Leeuwenhoekiella parthenopeia]